MNNQFFDHYQDDDGTIDDKLTLTSDGFVSFSEDLENLIEKYTGQEFMCPESDALSDIRMDLMFFMQSIVNNKGGENG